jgi:hypothetical protein
LLTSHSDVLEMVLAYVPKGTTNQDELIHWRGGECERCGYAFNSSNRHNFDWHHIDPKTKRFCIAAKVGCSLLMLKREARKCVLLCKMCHADAHIGRRVNNSVPNINLLGLT